MITALIIIGYLLSVAFCWYSLRRAHMEGLKGVNLGIIDFVICFIPLFNIFNGSLYVSDWENGANKLFKINKKGQK